VMGRKPVESGNANRTALLSEMLMGGFSRASRGNASAVGNSVAPADKALRSPLYLFAGYLYVNSEGLPFLQILECTIQCCSARFYQCPDHFAATHAKSQAKTMDSNNVSHIAAALASYIPTEVVFCSSLRGLGHVL
jgi:hypothetical protein